MTFEQTTDPEWIRTDIERTPTDVVDEPQSRVRRVAQAARSRASSGVTQVRTATAPRAQKAGHAVRGNPLPVAAGLLGAVGAVVVLVVRRRAAKQAAASQGRLAFLRPKR